MTADSGRRPSALILVVVSALVALALAASFVSRPGDGPGEAAAGTPVEKHRGVSWVAGPEISADALRPLADLHVNWIVQTPFGWQSAHDAPQIEMKTAGGFMWGELDVGLEKTARWGRDLGIKTLLKPHLWIRRGKWRGDVEMRSAEDWERWFADYRRFILHYARLAERTGMEGLAVGTELHRTVVAQPAEWRKLIREIRGLYSGVLTYAANWHREFEEVPFWDELDYIGIQAYFPLSADDERTSVADLKAGWATHLESIRRIQERFRKPVLFTEIGYKSTPGSTREPWLWLDRSDLETLPVDFDLQARAYRAFFETFWHEPWFAGAYIWKWNPPFEGEQPGFVFVGSAGPPEQNPDFTPQGKPAEEVLRTWYAPTAQ